MPQVHFMSDTRNVCYIWSVKFSHYIRVEKEKEIYREMEIRRKHAKIHPERKDKYICIIYIADAYIHYVYIYCTRHENRKRKKTMMPYRSHLIQIIFPTILRNIFVASLLVIC